METDVAALTVFEPAGAACEHAVVPVSVPGVLESPRVAPTGFTGLLPVAGMLCVAVLVVFA